MQRKVRGVRKRKRRDVGRRKEELKGVGVVVGV
jgi:hypothetical protein